MPQQIQKPPGSSDYLYAEYNFAYPARGTLLSADFTGIITVSAIDGDNDAVSTGNDRWAIIANGGAAIIPGWIAALDAPARAKIDYRQSDGNGSSDANPASLSNDGAQNPSSDQAGPALSTLAAMMSAPAPGPRDGPVMTLSLPFMGFNYVDFYNGEYSAANLASLMQVAMTGASSVAETPDWGIDVAQSSIYAGGATTDTFANQEAAMAAATQNGMTSFVRPLIDYLYNQVSANGPIFGSPGNYYVPPGAFAPANLPTGEPDANGGTIPTTHNGQVPAGDGTTSYRGDLNPADINVPVFFGSSTTPGSYDYMIVQEAIAAEQSGAKLFAVGVELDSLADNPAYTGYWDQLIADVRSAAPDLQLTYSANWSTSSEVTFWNQLDYVGVDEYLPLSNVVPNAANTNNPSLQSLIDGWTQLSNVQIAYSGGETVSEALGGQTAIDYFDTLAQQSISGKVIFTELGYPNDTSAATDPTGGSETGNPDPSLQAELYQAFFDAWGDAQATANSDGGSVDGIPFALDGFYIWDWTPDGSNDGWTVSANPAALQVVEEGMGNPCYCRGTLILTPAGEVAVEALAIGDEILTVSGMARPIKWIGRRDYGSRFALGRSQIQPVCVMAGALADGVPRRDLWVSPNHALYLEGALIEAADLVNGVSIVQPGNRDLIEYFHIELESHDVIAAEGAPAETYIDGGNRGLFHNAHEYCVLYPEEPHAEPCYCAPRLCEGELVERARAAITRRTWRGSASDPTKPIGSARLKNLPYPRHSWAS
jgi:hypothetical protein